MGVPNCCEMLIQKLRLLDSSQLVHSAEDVTGCDVGLVFLENTSTICFTEWRNIFFDGFDNVFLVVANIFFLLYEAEFPLFVFLVLPLCLLLITLFGSLFLGLLLLIFMFFSWFLLLGVFRAVDPLDVRFSLIILIHEGHYFVEFGLILSFLFWIGIFSLNLSRLHISYLKAWKYLSCIFVLIKWLMRLFVFLLVPDLLLLHQPSSGPLHASMLVLDEAI